jgi:hypothetical protein
MPTEGNRLLHRCLVVDTIWWGHVSHVFRYGKPCGAETTRVSRSGGQFRLARSNSPDLSDPSADSLARSVHSRPRRR